VYHGTLGYYQDGSACYPIVPGHEFSGTIVKVGANNKYRERFKPGDRIVSGCILSKGEGAKRQEIGVVNYNGAYSQYVVVPGDLIYKIPEGVDSKTAALAEPLSVVIRGMKRIEGRLAPESKVAVIGAGPIGHFSAQVLSLKGHKVTVFDKRKERLELIRKKVEGALSNLDGFEKFDVIIEATGAKDVLERILEKSRVDSTILLLGFPYGNINFNFEELVAREKHIVGSVGAEGKDFYHALGMLSKLDITPFTQKVMSLKDFEKAWELHQSSKHLKVLLKP
jgi:2-desacetyl-2-hydroxyethyl bacteriochlorophyllide A dehydrogenase